MRVGSVVKLKTTGEIGIVVSQSEDYVSVLFDDYKVYPINNINVEKTDKYFDLSIMWGMVKGCRQI